MINDIRHFLIEAVTLHEAVTLQQEHFSDDRLDCGTEKWVHWTGLRNATQTIAEGTGTIKSGAISVFPKT